jgi:hypothetical protein
MCMLLKKWNATENNSMLADWRQEIHSVHRITVTFIIPLVLLG